MKFYSGIRGHNDLNMLSTDISLINMKEMIKIDQNDESKKNKFFEHLCFQLFLKSVSTKCDDNNESIDI